MNKFPTAFCITLKETPARTSGFLKLANEAGISPVIFYGVLGSKLGLLPKFPNEIECPKKDIFLTENGIGCNLSHFMLWKVLVYSSEEEFLIFEDDAVIPSDFVSRFSVLYDKLPTDWQFVHVGWIPHGRDTEPLYVDDGISIRKPSGTHAYLIKKSALPILCDSLYPIQSNIDLTINKRCLGSLKHYVFDPTLVTQRSYLNTKDAEWISMIYDWKEDLYGYKRRLLRELNLMNGWYEIESLGDVCWRWSQDYFSIQLPRCVDNIVINCASPVDNSLTINCNQKQSTCDIKTGNNSISVYTGGDVKLTGNIKTPFTPSKQEEGSRDNRILGICLKEIVLNIGNISLETSVAEI